jgi:hypothetical protein
MTEEWVEKFYSVLFAGPLGFMLLCFNFSLLQLSMIYVDLFREVY